MTRTPVVHRIVSVLALLWNLGGLVMFWRQATMTEATIATLPEAQQIIEHTVPHWVLAFFGVAVATGMLGAIALLAGRRWAVPALLVSWIAIVLQLGSAYATAPVWSLTGVGGLVLPVVLVVLGIAQWVYARHARRRGWLR